MDQDQTAILQRVLSEHRLDAQHVLDVLVQTLVGRHINCELVKLGRRIQAQPRPDTLNAVMDALHEGRWLNAQANPALADVQKRLFDLLTECQFAAEEAAGISDDEDDDPPPPPMRIG